MGVPIENLEGGGGGSTTLLYKKRHKDILTKLKSSMIMLQIGFQQEVCLWFLIQHWTFPVCNLRCCPFSPYWKSLLLMGEWNQQHYFIKCIESTFTKSDHCNSIYIQRRKTLSRVALTNEDFWKLTKIHWNYFAPLLPSHLQ